MRKEEIKILVQRILKGYLVSKEDALDLLYTSSKEDLYEGAHIITQNIGGKGFDTCSIINVKSGNCPEDCKWCAQSRFYKTSAEIYPLLPTKECVDQAVFNSRQGINRFSLVASGRTASITEVRRMAKTYQEIKKNCNVNCCASLGLLDEERLQILYDAGVTTYHCNMETSPRFFKELCSTHTQEDKRKTIEMARKVGMRVCSGGIIGMGETQEDRIDFALYLRSLDILSIPINLLQPIEGTPLELANPLTEEEYLTTVALFRFINPKAYLRFSGGRIQIPIPVVRKAMYVGINSAITGDLLTTVGARVEEDMQMIEEMGYTTKTNTDWNS